MSVEYEEVTLGDKTFKIEKPKFNESLVDVETEVISEKSKKYWKHKPYKCDMGGVKNETL